ncbi:TauD/TfdA family dioxygenase [Alphaproteobacteria bacterium]|nr:TauD/TfdA family dioxygenase [Alphaproteobacteria bacterium]
MTNNLKIKPLPTVMGAVISGIDLRLKPNNKVKNSLLKAITDFSVICIRNQDLKPKDLVNVSRVFGTPKKYFIKDARIDGVPEVIVVANRAKDIKNKPKVYASHWHTDDSYREKPATLTFIYPKTLPENGGGTDFINCYSIYNELSEKMKSVIRNFCAVHKWQSRRNVSEVEKLSKEEEKLTPAVEHPLIRTHPMLGKKSLYINPNRNDHISGFNEDESDQLLDDLYNFSFQSKYQYSHNYKKVT